MSDTSKDHVDCPDCKGTGKVPRLTEHRDERTGLVVWVSKGEGGGYSVACPECAYRGGDHNPISCRYYAPPEPKATEEEEEA